MEITKGELLKLQQEDLNAAHEESAQNLLEKTARLKKMGGEEHRVLWTDRPSEHGIHRRGPTRNPK